MVTLADARTRIEAVVDPELPFVTIAELGILRDVAVDGEHVSVTITPTYSGCPAMQAIADDIRSALPGVDVPAHQSSPSPAANRPFGCPVHG